MRWMYLGRNFTLEYLLSQSFSALYQVLNTVSDSASERKRCVTTSERFETNYCQVQR